eukprot:748237-Hanusia_phi.AAC.2
MAGSDEMEGQAGDGQRSTMMSREDRLIEHVLSIFMAGREADVHHRQNLTCVLSSNYVPWILV